MSFQSVGMYLQFLKGTQTLNFQATTTQTHLFSQIQQGLHPRSKKELNENREYIHSKLS